MARIAEQELARVRDELAQQREGTCSPMDLLLGSVDWLWEERLILEEIEAKKK